MSEGQFSRVVDIVHLIRNAFWSTSRKYWGRAHEATGNDLHGANEATARSASPHISDIASIDRYPAGIRL